MKHGPTFAAKQSKKLGIATGNSKPTVGNNMKRVDIPKNTVVTTNIAQIFFEMRHDPLSICADSRIVLALINLGLIAFFAKR
jgi:hypothetical protein